MTLRTASSTTAWVALATGLASILASLLIILFYTVGGPFGTLNDIFNGIGSILSSALAWKLFSDFRMYSSFLNRFTLSLALIAAIIAVIGSILIIFDITGWVLAGWYTTVGNALIGIWLLTFSLFARQNNLLPANLSTFGIIVGSIMAVGIMAILGILMSIDSMESTPWYISVGFLGFLGSYLLYPLWALWSGRILLYRYNQNSSHLANSL